jgi:hypothetical protein
VACATTKPLIWIFGRLSSFTFFTVKESKETKSLIWIFGRFSLFTLPSASSQM